MHAEIPQEDAYKNAMATMAKHGAKVVENAELSASNDIFTVDGKSSFYEIACWSRREVIDLLTKLMLMSVYYIRRYNMQKFMDEFDGCEVGSIEEMIEYNKRHSDVCLPPGTSKPVAWIVTSHGQVLTVSDHPNQTEFYDLLENTTTEAECQATLAELRRRGHEGLDRLFETVDIVVALSDSGLVRYTSATGKSVPNPCLCILCVPRQTGAHLTVSIN
jgi:hypothetical protein